MGWFWNNKDDPVKKLDPNLREYLEHEAPAKYVPTTVSEDKPKETQSKPAPETADSKDQVPSASLFPDGRYAHLWKTYKPPVEVEASEKGANRVIEKYKERKDSVHRAAMENCALEHEDLTYCFQTGNWQKRLNARLTMCSDENAKFSRCFTTQAKFLQALGYASSFSYDEDKEERVQMHADKLYHQMLDYEKQAEDARAAGQEPPPLTSLFNPKAKPQPKTTDKTTELEIPGGESVPTTGFKPSKALERLTPHERELEIRAHNAQLEQQKLYVDEAAPFMKSQEDSRLKRKEKAVSWFGETIGKWIS